MLRKISKILAFAGVISSLSLAPVSAGDPMNTPVSAEILPGWTLPDGRRMAGLRLTLAPGWKTYWRVPGDAGIPPHFSWKGAKNVRSVTPSWPTPQVYYDYGMRSLGYTGTVTIPLAIEPKSRDAAIHLKGRMRLGICSDVCVPHQINLDSVLAPPSPRPTPAIAAAIADMPFSAGEADVTRAVCNIAPMEDGMSIEARVTLPRTGTEEVTVIEPGLDRVWTSEPKTKRTGSTLVATAHMIHVDEKPFSVDRSRVRITVIGSDYAVDILGCSGS